MPEARPILIAGAGIGGLTLAIALARQGMRVLVIERAPKLEEVGAGLQLSPNASRLLDALGLGPALDDAGVRPEAVRLVSGTTGRPIARMPLGSAAEKRWGAPYRLVHRAALQAILVAAAAREGLDIRLNHELVGFAEMDSEMLVRVQSGSGEKHISVAALIGADGVRSSVRKTLGANGLRFSGQVAWRATVPDRDASDMVAWLGPGAHLVTYPLVRTGLLNMVAVTAGRAAEGWSEPGDRGELLRAFSGWTRAVHELIASAETWLKWPLYEGHAARGTGAVTLMGDAAHPVLPHAAQGAAMAIEDAAVLAARLAETPDAPARAFRAYEEARRARTERVQAEARRNGDVFRLGGPLATMRNAALRLAGEERMTARLDWLYGHRAG